MLWLRAGRAGGGVIDVKHRWSLALPDEELYLHVIEGPSAEAVREATVGASLRCQRICQVVLLSADHIATEGGSQ